MSELISKELLSLVLGIDYNFRLRLQKDSICSDDRFCLIDDKDRVKCYNLDTLGRLIWEYIQTQGYQVIMRYDYPLIGAVLIDKDLKEVGDENDFISETPLKVWLLLLDFISKR